MPIKLRNKVYAALNRFVHTAKVTPEVAQSWEAAETKGSHAKFDFLQSWIKDTSGGQVKLMETHEKSTDAFEDSSWTWVTKWDLYLDKKAFGNPEMRAYCDKLLANAKTRKHPDIKFRNDPEMKLHRIMSSQLEGQRVATKRTSSMMISADVEPGAHASVMNSFLCKNARPFQDEEDAAAPKAGKPLKLCVKEMRFKKLHQDLLVGKQPSRTLRRATTSTST